MTAIMLPSMHLRNAIKREMPISTIVLTLPELLEMILSYASEEDLLFQQRVNTTWRRIINTSPELQEKLFLTSKVPEGDVDLTGLEWNPLLRHLGGRKDDLEGHDRCRSTDLKILEMSDYPGASWQKMFITRPAIGGLLMRDVIPHPLESHPLCTLWIEKGIMMSDVWGFQKMHGMYLHLRDREGRMPVHLCAPCSIYEGDRFEVSDVPLWGGTKQYRFPRCDYDVGSTGGANVIRIPEGTCDVYRVWPVIDRPDTVERQTGR